MNTTHSNNESLRIVALDFCPEQNEMLVTLSTGAVLRLSLSNYPVLQKASIDQLRQYTLISYGAGVHWPALDEDLSLKGFMQGATPVSLEQYNAEIEEAMKRMDGGEFYTHDQVKKMAKSWLNGK